MPNVVKCTFFGCKSNSNNCRDVSLFKYPITDRKRCEEWVKASNNPKVFELMAKNPHKLANKKVCEKHFHSNDISVYQLRKLLDQKSVPINHKINGDLNDNSFNSFMSNNSRKRVNNSLEIIEINDTNNKFKKTDNQFIGNHMEIIEINEEVIDNNKYMFGHELFKWKLNSSKSLDDENDEQIIDYNSDNDYNESQSQTNTKFSDNDETITPHISTQDIQSTQFNTNSVDIKHYSCKTKGCIFTTSSMRGLLIHSKAHKQIPHFYECNICLTNYRYENSLLRHRRVSHKETETPFKLIHMCDKCDHKFGHENNLLLHKKLFHEFEAQFKSKDTLFKCSFKDCDQKFKLLSQLSIHMNESHIKDRLFKCNFKDCDQCFVQMNQLSLHISQHESKTSKLIILDMK